MRVIAHRVVRQNNTVPNLLIFQLPAGSSLLQNHTLKKETFPSHVLFSRSDCGIIPDSIPSSGFLFNLRSNDLSLRVLHKNTIWQMHCKACQRMLSGESRKVSPAPSGELSPSFFHHKDGGKDLYIAAKAGCFLCKFIWGILSHIERAAVYPHDGRPGGKALHPSYYQIWKTDDKSSFRMLYWLSIRQKVSLGSGEMLHLNAGGTSVQRVISILPNSIAGWDEPFRSLCSSKTWCNMTCSIAQKWLKICDTSHSTCKAMYRSGWHPSRLVFVGTPSQPTLRISLRSDIDPNDRYITLSHCWGLAKFFTLTTSNYQQCLRRIQPEHLPQTFQDAITIARDLDTKYIWIDSLCIIQNSTEDWLRESLQMADVYSHSYCTIAAAAASDGTEGCIRTRPDATSSFRHEQHPKMSFFGLIPRKPRIYPRSSAASETGVFKWLPEGIYRFVDPMLWEHEVTSSPLSKRAWVLQESVLSPRTLYFCSGQVFFGCSSAGFCEEYPRGFPETIRTYKEMQPLIMSCGWSELDTRTSKPCAPSWTGHEIQGTPLGSGLSNDVSDPSYYLKCWNILLQDYCKRAITNPRDKLVALSGLANRIHAANPTTSYFAGLWRDSNDVRDQKLLDQILWQPAKPSSRLPTYIAPTWSWASIHGEISIDDFWLPESQQYLASLLNISVEVTGESPFGQVSSGSITLKAPLLPGKLAVDRESIRANSAYIRLAEQLGDANVKAEKSRKDHLMDIERYMHLQDRLFPSKVEGGVNKDREFFAITLDMEFSERRQFHPDSDDVVANMSVFCMPICRGHIINDEGEEEILSYVIRGLVLVEVPPEEHSVRSTSENQNGLTSLAGGRIFKRIGTFYEFSEFFALWNALYGQPEEQVVTII